MGIREEVEREWREREERIALYCSGAMDAQEEAIFELDMLECPDLATDTETAMILRDSIASGDILAGKASRAAWRRSPWLALTAGTLLGAVGMHLGVQSPIEQAGKVEFLTLGVVRGVEPIIRAGTINLTADESLVVEIPVGDSTSVEIERPNGDHEIVEGSRDEGFVRVLLKAPLVTGDYRITNGQTQHRFRVSPVGN